MPLVKHGRIVAGPLSSRVDDDAPIAGRRAGDRAGGTLPRRRRRARSARRRRLGVLWPNDRRVAELAPWLDRLALVALAFPNFRDGRAYSQARLLRERYGFRGELRATGDVLRDQFLFLIRAGFDSLEVKKDADAAAFAEAVGALQRVLSAERRRPRAGAAPPVGTGGLPISSTTGAAIRSIDNLF